MVGECQGLRGGVGMILYVDWVGLCFYCCLHTISTLVQYGVCPVRYQAFGYIMNKKILQSLQEASS